MTQTLSIPATPESIALIDISYLFKKRFHTTPQAERNAAAKATLRDLDWLREGVDHIIICRDAPPYSQRLAISPDYKANRPTPEPEEKAQKRWLFEEIKRLGYAVAYSQGFEADDVIATLCKSYGGWCEDVRIVGPDKDCAQCINTHVKQYIPPIGTKDWEVRDAAACKTKFGVLPELMILYQGLVGDATDNIPGVPKVGPKTAADLANKYPSLAQLAAGLATEAKTAGSKPSAILQSLATHWESLVLSMKLATLDTNVPLDAQALLVMREELPAKEEHNDMDPEPPMKQDGVTDAAFEEASKLYQQKFPVEAAKDAGLLEKENDREREKNEEHEAREQAARRVPTKSEVVPGPAKSAAPLTNQIVQRPAEASRYGLVTSDLQPMDLTSAYQLSQWLFKGGLFRQYKSESQIFTIIVRGKELGLGVTTALANHHIIDGKPVAHADLIRALAERDPGFEYLMPTKMSATSVTWKGKHKRQPEAVEYTYTIEDARAAGLCRKDTYGKPGNWETRPQDMLVKTAGSKLARLLWPGATMGCYCPEEMGYTSEELDSREAA